jgi:hypothetical protein
MAVGGQRNIKRLAILGAQVRQFLNQLNKPAAQEWFTASQPYLCDSEAYKKLDQAQVFVNAQFGILRADFAGPAVDALVVASVGDGNTQVVDDASVAVGQP